MKFFLKERLKSARVDDVMSGGKVGDPGRTRRQEMCRSGGSGYCRYEVHVCRQVRVMGRKRLCRWR